MLIPYLPLGIVRSFFFSEYLADWRDTQGQSFESMIDLGFSKGSQFSCLVVQLAMPESVSYVQFAKFYFFICNPVYDGLQVRYLAVVVVNQCLV